MLFARRRSEEQHFLPDQIYDFFSRSAEVLGHRVCRGVDGFATLETYCDERYGDWGADADGGTDFNLSFYPGLRETKSALIRALDE